MLGWASKGAQQLFVRISRDGITFDRDAKAVGGRSGHSPALGNFNGGVAAAWVDLTSKKLHVARSDGGEVWGNATTTKFSSLSPPALAAWGGRLVLAWRGHGDNLVHLADSLDAQRWANERVIAETTYSGPALSAVDSRLVLACRSPSGEIVAADVTGATGLTYRVLLRAATAARPSLGTHENRLFLAWNDGPVRFLEEAGPGKWVGRAQIDGQCLDGPAMVTHAGRLVVATVARDAGNRLRLTLLGHAR